MRFFRVALDKREIEQINHYSMIIQWSDEERLFLVTIPEFSDHVIYHAVYSW